MCALRVLRSVEACAASIRWAFVKHAALVSVRNEHCSWRPLGNKSVIFGDWLSAAI